MKFAGIPIIFAGREKRPNPAIFSLDALFANRAKTTRHKRFVATVARYRFNQSPEAIIVSGKVRAYSYTQAIRTLRSSRRTGTRRRL